MPRGHVLFFKLKYNNDVGIFCPNRGTPVHSPRAYMIYLPLSVLGWQMLPHCRWTLTLDGWPPFESSNVEPEAELGAITARERGTELLEIGPWP